ncbi:MAG TPA: ROK family protein, partial [Oligoflexia bacterium]|nr:ROK family protein [Oligoflexia bacterium]
MAAAKLYFGGDVGGTSEKLGVRFAECSAEPQNFVVIPTGGVDVPLFIERTIVGTEQLVCSVGAAPGDIAAFALLIPGQIDFRKRRIISVPNLPGSGWCGCPIADELHDAFEQRLHVSVPVVLYHDARGAGIGEACQGAAKGANVVAGITTGAGIGGFVVWFDGSLMHVFDGAHQLGTEFGHMKIPGLPGRPKPHRCGCGQEGCWETYAGANGIMHFAQT